MKIKGFISAGVLGVLMMALAACSPTASQLKKTLVENPDIVFDVIKEHPDKFLEVVNQAARDAQRKAREREIEDREKEFDSPKEPKIADDRAIKGPKDAPITIVEYSDFQCPYCSKGYEHLQEVLKAYPNKIRFVYKHLPLRNHPLAMPAAQYFEAIAMQSAEKAYKFHDKLFENQSKINKDGEKFFKKVAKDLGVDMKKLDNDLKSKEVEARIKSDMEEAQEFGFTGTPGFLINGVKLAGAYPPPQFKKIIDKWLERLDKKG